MEGAHPSGRAPPTPSSRDVILVCRRGLRGFPAYDTGLLQGLDFSLIFLSPLENVALANHTRLPPGMGGEAKSGSGNKKAARVGGAWLEEPWATC